MAFTGSFDGRLVDAEIGIGGVSFNDMSVKEIILGINPNYEFTFEDGYAPQDILVAYIKK